MSGGPGQRAPLLTVPEEPPLHSDGLCADVCPPECCRVGPGWLRQDHRSRWQINEEGHLTTFVILCSGVAAVVEVCKRLRSLSLAKTLITDISLQVLIISSKVLKSIEHASITVITASIHW